MIDPKLRDALAERLAARSVPLDSGCIKWTGYTKRATRPNSTPYGFIKVLRVWHPVHRIAYLLAGNVIPDGMVLDHLCRNTLCLNPLHLRVTTRGQNVLCGIGPTAVNASKTICKRGHPLVGDGADVHIDPRGQRVCRKCRRFRVRRNYHQSVAGCWQS